MYCGRTGYTDCGWLQLARLRLLVSGEPAESSSDVLQTYRVATGGHIASERKPCVEVERDPGQKLVGAFGVVLYCNIATGNSDVSCAECRRPSRTLICPFRSCNHHRLCSATLYLACEPTSNKATSESVTFGSPSCAPPRDKIPPVSQQAVASAQRNDCIPLLPGRLVRPCMLHGAHNRPIESTVHLFLCLCRCSSRSMVRQPSI